jgi:deazaflavin-dependent oxidoreductase (nitroreductase family)
MKIPEPLFVIVNFVVRVLLKSPLHFLMSDSVLLINYRGRKSGKKFSTPVRYLDTGACFRCVTSEEVQWWRNVQANPAVTLLVSGANHSCSATILERNPTRVQELLSEFLAVYPQDAVYQDIRLNPDGSLNSDDLIAASHKAILVDFEKEYQD